MAAKKQASKTTKAKQPQQTRARASSGATDAQNGISVREPAPAKGRKSKQNQAPQALKAFR
jgi:hypothetical protein